MSDKSKQILVEDRISSSCGTKKKVVFRFQSVNSIVIPAASTGNDNSNSTTVIKTNHTNNGIWYWDIAGGFILITVILKLIVPKHTCNV